MSKLIIDAAKDKIFLMIINNDTNYSITHENTKNNYEKLTILINELLDKKKLNFKQISCQKKKYKDNLHIRTQID